MPPDEKVFSANTQSADWLYPDLAYAVCGRLYEVHNILGPGFVHRIYANACYRELQLRGLPSNQPSDAMTYKGMVIEMFAFLIFWSKTSHGVPVPSAISRIPPGQFEGLDRTCGIQLGYSPTLICSSGCRVVRHREESVQLELSD